MIIIESYADMPTQDAIHYFIIRRRGMIALCLRDISAADLYGLILSC